MNQIERATPRKIFISGAMTGVPNYNRDAFVNAQRYLEHYNHIVLNPAWFPVGLEYEDYMTICTAMICACDAVYVLRDSEHSKGSRREIEFAQGLGLDIYYEEA